MRNSWQDVNQAVMERVHGVQPDALFYAGGAIFYRGKAMRGGRWGCPEKHCPYEKYPTKFVLHRTRSMLYSDYAS